MARITAPHGVKKLKYVSVLVLLPALALTGCFFGGDGGSSAGASAPASAGPLKPDKVLKASMLTVRGAVDAVIRPSEQLAVKQERTMDVAAGCQVGAAGPWPRRWGYGRRVVLPGGNHVTAANNAVRTLRAEGWQIQVNQSIEGVVDVDARQGDVLLHIVGQPSPSSLLVEGYGACVRADGTTGRP